MIRDMNQTDASTDPRLMRSSQALAVPVSGRDFVVESEIDFSDVTLPAEAERIGGMISSNEKRLLHGLARNYYTGAGSIIDAGTFLGSSTAALASGLIANSQSATIRAAFRSRGDRPVWGYDRGYLQETAEPEVAKSAQFGDATIVLGQSYEAILRTNVSPFGDITELVIGDFLKQAWPPNRPIEICFIDLAKTQALSRHTVRQFFPALIPGRSIVVQQDFFFDRLPWLKVLMGHFHDRFKWLGQVGASSIYQCIKPIAAAECLVEPYLTLTPDACVAAHRAAEYHGLSRRRLFSLQISLAYLMDHRLSIEDANAHLDRVEIEYADILASATKGPMTAKGRIARARRRLPHEILKLDARAHGQARGSAPI